MLVPFWLTVFTLRLTMGLLGAYMYESVELLMQNMFGTFVFFAGANNNLESLGIVLEDMIQGVFASILGVIFLWVFNDAPALIQLEDLYPSNIRKRFWRVAFYVFFGLVAVAPGAALLGLGDGTYGFRIGYVLYPIFFMAGVLPIIWAQYAHVVWPFAPEESPVTWTSWSGKTQVEWRSWTEYWVTGIVYTLIMSIQSGFDYLYSSAIQSWLWSALFLFYLVGRKYWK